MDNVLLVEGKDELHVFSSIFKIHSVNESFEPSSKDGVDNIFKGIPTRLNTGKPIIIGIVIDADLDRKAKWTKLKGILEKLGFNLPKAPKYDGTIIKKDNKTIGVWIMPNNNINGMLEDFVKELVPSNDELMEYVNHTLEEIENRKVNKYDTKHRSKATIHTWLAWQKDPGTPMGLAITKTYLDTNKDLCQKFVKWVNDLFNNA